MQLKRQVFYPSKIGPSINQLISGEREIGWGEYPYFYLKYDIDAYGFPTGTDDRSAPEVKRLTLLRVVHTQAI